MESVMGQNKSIDRKKWIPGKKPFSAGRLRLVAALLAWLATNTAGQASAQVEERAEAQTEADGKRRVLFIRPHAGVGWAAGYNRSGDALALHAGGRILFPAPLSPKVGATFGLEATYLQLDITGRNIFSERYAAVGVVLEMTVVRGFNLGIGTLGYIGVGGTDRNPFGVVTNLGWEPAWESRVRPYITLRTEWVFDQATYNVLSLSVGVTFGI
ncbi:MAG: hypothetical protein KJN97_13290 [Deltaproteobacteria bacterium]|nr:hypothetical protein [Deltaproteobacteria bacterium]